MMRKRNRFTIPGPKELRSRSASGFAALVAARAAAGCGGEDDFYGHGVSVAHGFVLDGTLAAVQTSIKSSNAPTAARASS